MRESSKRDKDERLQAAENQEHLRNEKNLSFVETFKNKILKVKVEETNRNQSKLVHVHGREKKKQDKHGSVPNIFAEVLFKAGCYMSVRKIESYESSFLFEMLC